MRGDGNVALSESRGPIGRILRCMAVGPVLTIQARQPGDDGWMTWVDSQIAGKVFSLEEALEKARTYGCVPREIRWPDGSYDQMVEAGVAPADPPDLR